jgi:hypothetical protein
MHTLPFVEVMIGDSILISKASQKLIGIRRYPEK